MGEFRVSGFFAAAKMTHLSDDKTVAKMGHPMVAVRSNVGHPSGMTDKGDRQQKQQIPPLRCGMTNKEQTKEQATADSSAALRNDRQRDRQQQQQIPPRRCGMTNKEQTKEQATADPPPSAKDDN
jgi:hypothetical protein